MTTSKEGRSLADGTFVTSGKRAYSEYVFDIEKDENGNLSKRKPARRGPLNESTIQGIDALKQGGGACWRCKILKKPVSMEYCLFQTRLSLMVLNSAMPDHRASNAQIITAHYGRLGVVEGACMNSSNTNFLVSFV